MALSEKIEEIKFAKSVAGYAIKEVDGFMADLLLLAKEEEQLIMVLRAKLEAFELQRDDIKKQEHEAYKLLEAAKKEAEIIVATAKKNAETIVSEAQVDAEVQVRSATARANDILENADALSNAKISDAYASAEKIIADASQKSKEMLEQVKAACDEEMRKAKALANECASFETRFRTIVADTAQALMKIKEETPVPYDAAAIKAPEKAVESHASEAEEKAPALATEEITPVEKVEETKESTDVEFAGGKPVAALAKKEEKTQRKLYDNVQVTYDAENDFEQIRDIMKGPERKSPTHFSD